MTHYISQKLNEEVHELVTDMFDWLVQPSLDYVRKHCKTFVRTSEMHMVLTMQRLYTSLMDEILQTLGASLDDSDDMPGAPSVLTQQQVC
jgi:dynein heavy chain